MTRQKTQRHSVWLYTFKEKRDSEGRLIRREMIKWRKEPRKRVYNKNAKRYEYVD